MNRHFQIRVILIFCLSIILKINLSAQDAYKKLNGTIKGRVVDETTRNPLPAVNVLIEGTQMGAAADTSGTFIIEHVPAGVYNLRFRMIGYETRILSNIVVSPGKPTTRQVEMNSTILDTEGVVVTAGFFHEAKDAVISNRSMDFEEIRSDPGSAEDVQRVVQALPSVVSAADQDNEIIVRGGMPGENLFIMDNIEIPNPNHFGYQGTSGGPINMLNPYFVRRVDFYAGAFPVRYGDRASSVMDISLRDGNRERYAGHFYLGMAGAGAMAEGPINDGKGSWILSARKSFLDLIIESTGLTAVPKYYSLQGKMSYDFSPKYKLTINGIFGDDNITIEDEEEEAGYSRGAENVRSQSYQYAFGATLRTLYGKKGVSKLTLYQTLNNWDQYVYDEDDDPYYKNLSTEIERAAKYDLTLLLSRRFEIDIGAIAKAVSFDIDEWADADTIFTYDTSVEPHQKIGIFQRYPVWQGNNDETSFKTGFYGQVKFFPFSRLAVTAGVRGDYFDYIAEAAIDPRIGFSWNFLKDMKLKLAVAQHSQSPAYVSITANPKNSELSYKQTRQVVAGVERLFREDMKGTLEIFYKDYRKVPIPISWKTPDPFDRGEGRLVSEGKGFSKGIEFFLQNKMSGRYFFTVSYAYSISKGFDPRYNTYYDWDYDYRHIFTFINGIRFNLQNKHWYRNMAEKTWYKMLAWALPFADQVEVSTRWRYLGGRPYTEQTYYPNLHHWVVEETQLSNTLRFPAYHRLDFRLDRRFMYRNLTLVTYIDIINIYGRDNIWTYNYNSDGTVEKVYQWEVFPVGGLAIEF